MYDTGLRRSVLRWYARNGRDLPWRRTQDPYAVLVSEVMLQQTQVARVVPAHARFLERFPTLGVLARARLASVLRAWAGLGYNRRARDLQRAARVARTGLPRTREGLDALPGIGAYTAGAVACFAYGTTGGFADTNIRRVLGRAIIGRVATEREAVALDERLAPRRAAARWHHALMDLGATICTARAPRCEVCPLRASCVARRAGAIPSAATRKTGPFATSDRRVRGAIVSALRTAPCGLTRSALAARVGDARVERLTQALVDEGLISRRGALLRLG